MKVIVNNSNVYDVTFCPGRNYISSVTKLLKDYGLRQEDGVIVEKTASWSIDANQTIRLSIK